MLPLSFTYPKKKTVILLYSFGGERLLRNGEQPLLNSEQSPRNGEEPLLNNECLLQGTAVPLRNAEYLLLYGGLPLRNYEAPQPKVEQPRQDIEALCRNTEQFLQHTEPHHLTL